MNPYNSIIPKGIMLAVYALLIFLNLSAQQSITPEKLGWKAYSIANDLLGTVNYYITSNKLENKKPILLYLDGSGAYPLYQYTARGIGSTIPLDVKALSEQYHVITISKPGVPFIDSVGTNPATGYPEYKTPLAYKERLSLEWRVNAANLVLAEVLQKQAVDQTKIAVLGISEGFQVGSKLLTVNKEVTHAILLVGNGLNQLYDFIIQNRMDAQIGKITLEEAQRNIDSLMTIFRDIYQNEQATDKEWYGHTYLRWSSFCKNIPLENLLSVSIPVYVVSASNDTNTTVLSSDYIALESLRKGKNHIEYKVYPYDHSMTELIKDATGRVVSTKNHLREVLAEALHWLDKKESLKRSGNAQTDK